MDISNEATVDSFSIGPTSILGRTIAFRVLCSKSISHLRHQLFYIVWSFVKNFRNCMVPLLSWFHPRNPQGILAMVTVIAFILKRYTNVKSKAEMAYRRKFWRNMMRAAVTYEEWSHAAKLLDKETPKANETDLYDVELVRNKLQELRHRRHEGSVRDITFFMRADLIRNLGNMCNPELHKGRLQVPSLIKDYIAEVSTQLRMVCDSDSDELSLEEKLAFMHETRHAFGRTALLLSGGASLGSFHAGVVKTLVEHKVLPRIIAGSSVGSIMCSIVATRSWPELQSFFEDSWHSLQFFDQLGGIFAVVKRVMTQGAVHEIRQLQWMLRHLTCNLTFQEAYDITGRILCITVCSPRKHEPPRCLNYLTSPHVVIWSAVTASCAFPGLFEAQELMAKDRSGELVPYHPPFNLDPVEGSSPSVRRWRDGSLEIDLPMMQLKELFNVNHFIVSQANPHIAPLLRLKEFVRAYGGRFAAKLAQLLEMEVKHRCNQILELGIPMGGLAKLFAQDWEADVTIVMPATLAQYSKLIQNPSYLDLQKASNQGRRCTWAKLSTIKANCGIELALDDSVSVLNHMRRLKRTERSAGSTQPGLANTTKFSGSRRIPSWNCIARENSTGSLEDDVNLRNYRNMHDGNGSDSESEGVEVNTWTRSGGPLMRTTSANTFIEFFQYLNVEPDSTTGLMVYPPLSPGVQMGQMGQSPRMTTLDRNSDNETDQRGDYGTRNSPTGLTSNPIYPGVQMGGRDPFSQNPRMTTLDRNSDNETDQRGDYGTRNSPTGLTSYPSNPISPGVQMGGRDSFGQSPRMTTLDRGSDNETDQRGDYGTRNSATGLMSYPSNPISPGVEMGGRGDSFGQSSRMTTLDRGPDNETDQRDNGTRNTPSGLTSYPSDPRETTLDRSLDNETEHGVRNNVSGSSSIVVTDGDFLQPEKIDNGIVFNVVRREELPNSSPGQNLEAAECVDCSEKEMMDDGSSTSESGGDDYVATSD